MAGEQEDEGREEGFTVSGFSTVVEKKFPADFHLSIKPARLDYPGMASRVSHLWHLVPLAQDEAASTASPQGLRLVYVLVVRQNPALCALTAPSCLHACAMQFQDN